MRYARCKGGFYKCALSDFEIVFEDKFLAAHDVEQLSLIVNIIPFGFFVDKEKIIG